MPDLHGIRLQVAAVSAVRANPELYRVAQPQGGPRADLSIREAGVEAVAVALPTDSLAAEESGAHPVHRCAGAGFPGCALLDDPPRYRRCDPISGGSVLRNDQG